MKNTLTSTTNEFAQSVERVLNALSPRSQEIVRARFGIDGDSPKTLEAIGKRYGITRERVRQILQNSLSNVKKKNIAKEYTDSVARIHDLLDSSSGVMTEEDIMTALDATEQEEQGAILFFLHCSDGVCIPRSTALLPSHARTDFDVKSWKKFHQTVRDYFAEKDDVVEEEALLNELTEQLKDMKREAIMHNLLVSKEIQKNPFGKWGLSEWKKITPKGVREKVYLVLSEEGEPMHFRTIAEKIDAYGLGKMNRPTHPQTVHNELIKDSRFVLVGRGIYALSEWGYERGTVKDVVQQILTDRKQPMTLEEILNEVLKVRSVKKSTVMINLKTFFERNGQNCYTIKENR